MNSRLLCAILLLSASALPSYAAPLTAVPAAQAQAVKPLLVIRFNQKHVSFERTLKQAVAAVKKAKPDAVYSVVSAVPPIVPGSQLNNDADRNLISVVSMMEKLGVAASRISSGTQNGTAANQEISIYVQ